MICEKCNKNEATVHMTQIINGDKVQIHLCEGCAKNIGFETPISFQDIFQGLLNLTGMQQKGERADGYTQARISCPECGMTFEEFRKTGKLGCASCYKTFKSYLDTTLTSIHGSNVHRGKFPQKTGGTMLKKREIETLKRKLALAVEEEEYEEAALIRDKIKELEKGE